MADRNWTAVRRQPAADYIEAGGGVVLWIKPSDLIVSKLQMLGIRRSWNTAHILRAFKGIRWQVLIRTRGLPSQAKDVRGWYWLNLVFSRLTSAPISTPSRPGGSFAGFNQRPGQAW
ncbi:hypothetical protein SCLCIDRAFT_858309 [Scleroderma citrinum Foug A]|uniref:Uncharacterized protein n=1 Tax=Scleroderma citrinum Foug A TaxID=1036808 RepID=A0A0C3AAC5_9AGAM|nr:hypothetical protein SCLCIDRAFT_858309 [Scleroderma citrinum Foug A]